MLQDLRQIAYIMDAFYFFNIHQAMVLVELNDGEATITWVGTHQECEKTFRNTKNTAKKWLKSNDWL